jgi:hypothetical protein
MKLSTLGKSMAKCFLVATLLCSVFAQLVSIKSENLIIGILSGWLTYVVVGLFVSFLPPLYKTVWKKSALTVSEE